MNFEQLKQHWEKLLANQGMPADIDQIGTRAKIHNGRSVPVVKFTEEMTARLLVWPYQGDTADQAASSNPTVEAAEARLESPKT